MKNPLSYHSDSAGEQSGGAQEVPYGACVGSRFACFRSFEIDRLDALAHGAASRDG